MFVCHAAVGVGSWCFHMTLLYEMQVGYCNCVTLNFYYFSKKCVQNNFLLKLQGIVALGNIFNGNITSNFCCLQRFYVMLKWCNLILMY